MSRRNDSCLGARALGRWWQIPLVLAVAVLVVFWPVLGNDFVNYDDNFYVTHNAHVQQGFTPEALRWAWSTGHMANWHPLTWMSHMLDWRLFGANPAGHHATSVVLHALSTGLVFILLVTMTGSPARSALVAAVFGLHPLRIESVAWVAERKDVLSTCFWLLSTLAYVAWTRRPTRGRYLLVLLGLTLGLMAKPMLVTLPATLLLLDVWPLYRLGGLRELWPRVREKLPLMLPVVASCIITVVVQRHGGAVGTIDAFPLPTRIGNAIVAYVVYLWKFFWPVDLYVPYLHLRGGISPAAVTAAAALLVVLTAFAFRVRAPRPYVLVGWLWYLGTLVPVIGLVQTGEQAMADRYTYVPQLGLLIALAWLVPVRAGLPVGALTIVVLVLLALRTRAQITVWKNSVVLFEHALALAESNPVAHLNLGYALGDRGDLEAARRHLERALELRPDSAKAHVGLGNVLVGRDRTDEGIAHYRRALALEPDSPYALANLGYAFARKGQYDEAIALYRRALVVDPYLAVAHKYLGVALAGTGRPAEALVHFEYSVRYDPSDADALNDLGAVLMAIGRVSEGLTWVDRAVARSPRFAGAHTNRILGLYQLGRYSDAWAAVRLARAAEAPPPDALIEALASKMPQPAG